jgi:hypothetical protein
LDRKIAICYSEVCEFVLPFPLTRAVDFKKHALPYPQQSPGSAFEMISDPLVTQNKGFAQNFNWLDTPEISWGPLLPFKAEKDFRFCRMMDRLWLSYFHFRVSFSECHGDGNDRLTYKTDAG